MLFLFIRRLVEIVVDGAECAVGDAAGDEEESTIMVDENLYGVNSGLVLVLDFYFRMMSLCYAIDDFGRSADNLVREWKPETGFALQQNNTTDVYWTLTDIHLEAAGVNFNEKSRGWQIQIVYFNEFFLLIIINIIFFKND